MKGRFVGEWEREKETRKVEDLKPVRRRERGNRIGRG